MMPGLQTVFFFFVISCVSDQCIVDNVLIYYLGNMCCAGQCILLRVLGKNYLSWARPTQHRPGPRGHLRPVASYFQHLAVNSRYDKYDGLVLYKIRWSTIDNGQSTQDLVDSQVQLVLIVFNANILLWCIGFITTSRGFNSSYSSQKCYLIKLANRFLKTNKYGSILLCLKLSWQSICQGSWVQIQMRTI